MKKQISIEDIAKRYNALDNIIDADDNWHLSTKQIISEYIHRVIETVPEYKALKILNAGSAGYSYGLSEDNIIHVDVAEKHISNLKNSILCSVENIPVENEAFDMIICVGSVLNYCDPLKVFSEFSRVMKPGSYLILEYENSKTFELLFKKGFAKSAAYIETFFDAHYDKEKIWVFSEPFISKITTSYNFKITNIKRFHIISPLIYRLTGNSNFASKFIRFDSFFRKVPGLKKYSSNIIFSAIKKS